MNLNSKMSAHCLWGLNKKCDYEWKAETGNTNIHCQSLSRCLKELRACWPLLSIALHPTNTPHTVAEKSPIQFSIQTRYKATPQSHSSTDPVTLRPSDPPPPPSCRKPGLGEESLSRILIQLSTPRFNFIKVSFVAFPSSTHHFTHNVHPQHSLNRVSVLLVQVSLKSVFLLLLQVQQLLCNISSFLLKNKPRKDVQILAWSWKRLTALTKFSHGFTTNKTKNTKDIEIKS